MHRSYGLQGSLKRRYKHPSLLPSMGTTRQKSSCRNGLQNGPRLLSRVKAGTHSPSPTGSHTAAYTPKQGAFRMGVVSLLSERSARSPTSPGRVSERRTLPLLGLGRGFSRRRRGPAGLRNLFRFCRNCGLYTLRSELSARARRGWYHYPRRALRAAETPDGRLPKGLICRFLRLPSSTPCAVTFSANMQISLSAISVANTFALWYDKSQIRIFRR